MLARAWGDPGPIGNRQRPGGGGLSRRFPARLSIATREMPTRTSGAGDLAFERAGRLDEAEATYSQSDRAAAGLVGVPTVTSAIS